MSTEEKDKVPVEQKQVKEKCPAFKDGCPYSKVTEHLFMEELQKCPAFSKGCPFKDAKCIQDVKEEMAKMPETKHHEGASHEQLLKMLQSVHEVSRGLEKEVGECPVFKTETGGCPFKSASEGGKYLVEPPSAVLSTADLAKLKELCPAFEKGCPFAKLENEELLKEIKKCPEFKEGCAFKELHSMEEIYHKLEEMPNTGESCHHRDVLLKTMKIIHGIGHEKADECPVLKKLGCPFKGVQSEGKPLIQPVDAVLPEEGSHDTGASAAEDLKAVDLGNLKEKCPAFEKGCPFAQIGEKDFLKNIKECPEFKSGCPFKDMENMADVYEKLSKLPAFSDKDSHGAKLLDTLMTVHNISRDLKEDMGECPVFASDGCPFKSICSDGKPLIENLESHRWTQVFYASVESELESVAMQVSKKEPNIQLSKELKKGTTVLHRAAENVHFVKDFVKGRIESYWYRVLLADLYFVYSALEEESRKNKEDPLFGAIHFPEKLERVESIKEDLEFYFGEDWEEQVTMSDATKEYVERLRKISAEDPTLLISHHYTRYLGDLSGGSVLKKMAAKAMNLPSTGEGVKFFTFDKVSNAREFKNHYRSVIDNLNVTKEVSDKLVKEANVAFLLNIKIFKEIDAMAGFEEEEMEKQNTKEVVEELPQEHPQDQGEAKCPFATMAQEARREQQQETEKHKQQQQVASEPSPLVNPLVLALLVAGIAVILGLYLFRN